MDSPGPAPSLADAAYAALHRRVTRCELAPGTRLVARDLADDLGLGLTPVREALHRLQRDGLVVTLPRRGYLVRPLTPARARDTLDAWRVLGPRVAALAVRQGTLGRTALAAALAAAFPDALRPDGAQARSRARLRVAGMTGNALLVDVVRRLDAHLVRLEHRVAGLPERAHPPADGPAGPSWGEVVVGRDPDAAAARAASGADAFAAAVGARLGAGDAPDAAAAGSAGDPSLADLAWHVLRDAVLRGVLPPGAHVTAAQLSARTGLGLTPIREALGRLDDERLVTTAPRRGYTVTRTTPQDALETIEVWSFIAPHVVDLAVRNATPEQARAVVEAMGASGGSSAEVVARRQHGWRLLVAAAGNVVLDEMLTVLDGVLGRVLIQLVRTPGSPIRLMPLDWAGLFARRDPQEARDQAESYARSALAGLAAWAAELHDRPPARRDARTGGLWAYAAATEGRYISSRNTGR